MKLGTQFGTDFEQYKNLEDGKIKSEAGFLDYLGAKDNLTRGEVAKRFRSFLYNSILDDPENRLSERVAVGNRATDDKPITMNGLTTSLFASFLFRQPVSDNMTTGSYKRGSEARNMVTLMNMIDELGMNEWNPKVAKTNDKQLKLTRIVRARFMKAWAELLKDAVCARLNLHDRDEISKPFYRELTDEDLQHVRFCVARLVDWKIWSSPLTTEIDQVRLDNDRMVKDWLREKGLTTGYLMGAPQ